MTFHKKLFLLIAIISIFSFTALRVSAHDVSMGGSEWSFGKNNITASVELNVTLLNQIKGINAAHINLEKCSDAQLKQIAADIIQPYINKKLTVWINNKVYPIKVSNLVMEDDYYYSILLNIDNINFKNSENQVKIEYRLLFEETNGLHSNIATIHLSDIDTDIVQAVLESDSSTWEGTIKCPSNLSAAVKDNEVTPGNNSKASNSISPNSFLSSTTSQNSSTAYSNNGNSPVSGGAANNEFFLNIREFLLLGIKHILTGYDHILFLLALIVIGLTIKEVLRIITAFTIAHSLTLLLAALQIVRLDSRFVESVIALSICYVSLENLFRKKVNYRWIVTFAFGLIHGFGFASILQELVLVKSNLIPSVLSFNLGVEIGQLLIFLVMFPILHILKKKFEPRKITVVASAIIFVMGFTWLIERAFSIKILWF